jgi:hypothetical protein
MAKPSFREFSIGVKDAVTMLGRVAQAYEHSNQPEGKKLIDARIEQLSQPIIDAKAALDKPGADMAKIENAAVALILPMLSQLKKDMPGIASNMSKLLGPNNTGLANHLFNGSHGSLDALGRDGKGGLEKSIRHLESKETDSGPREVSTYSRGGGSGYVVNPKPVTHAATERGGAVRANLSQLTPAQFRAQMLTGGRG